jgi:hypothetical protein
VEYFDISEFCIKKRLEESILIDTLASEPFQYEGQEAGDVTSGNVDQSQESLLLDCGTLSDLYGKEALDKLETGAQSISARQPADETGKQSRQKAAGTFNGKSLLELWNGFKATANSHH